MLMPITTNTAGRQASSSQVVIPQQEASQAPEVFCQESGGYPRCVAYLDLTSCSEQGQNSEPALAPVLGSVGGNPNALRHKRAEGVMWERPGVLPGVVRCPHRSGSAIGLSAAFLAVRAREQPSAGKRR